MLQEDNEVMDEGSQYMLELTKRLMSRLSLKMEGQMQTRSKDTAKSITELSVDLG